MLDVYNDTEKTEYIGISENRLHHLLGVARECYQIAKEEGYDEDFCQKMFVIGFLHDIGYEFSQRREKHPEVSAHLLELFMGNMQTLEESNSYEAIKLHGKYPERETDEWRILNKADLTIDCKGCRVDVEQRLKGIKARYGADSGEYMAACSCAYLVGLTGA